MTASLSITLPVNASHSPDDKALRRLVADELDSARDALEAVIAALCADADIAKRHLPVLQSVDIIGQRHENLARVLRADNMAVAAEAITLDSLRDHMLAGIRALD